MMIVMGAIVRFATVSPGFEFIGKRGSPFFPCKVSLLGELHRERKCLGLPGFGEHRPARVARETRQIEVRRAQGSRPTCPDERNPAVMHARPKVRERENVRSRRAGASR